MSGYLTPGSSTNGGARRITSDAGWVSSFGDRDGSFIITGYEGIAQTASIYTGAAPIAYGDGTALTVKGRPFQASVMGLIWTQPDVWTATVATNSSSGTIRNDLIVLRLDLSTSPASASYVTIAGTPAVGGGAIPISSMLSGAGAKYDMAIAWVAVQNGSNLIPAANVTMIAPYRPPGDRLGLGRVLYSEAGATQTGIASETQIGVGTETGAKGTIYVPAGGRTMEVAWRAHVAASALDTPIVIKLKDVTTSTVLDTGEFIAQISTQTFVGSRDIAFNAGVHKLVLYVAQPSTWAGTLTVASSSAHPAFLRVTDINQWAG